LGETSTTAYAGNKGKANAEAIEALQTSVVHKTDAETISGYKTFSSGLNSSSNIQIDNNDGEYLSISGSTLFRGNGSGPDSYIDIPRNKGTSSAHATLAITDDIPDVSGKANDSAVVHKTGDESIAGTKTFNDTIYSEYGFNAAHEDPTKEYGTEYSSEYIQTFIYGKGNNNEFKECYFMLPDKSSGEYYLATVDDIQTISGAENFVQIGTSSSPVDQTIYGIKTFNDTVYSNGNFNTNTSGTYASYGARAIALGTNSSPDIILNLPTTSGTHTLALDDEVIHLAGDETITGAKTFKGSDLTFISGTYN
jgi:hypothetical protein